MRRFLQSFLGGIIGLTYNNSHPQPCGHALAAIEHLSGASVPPAALEERQTAYNAALEGLTSRSLSSLVLILAPGGMTEMSLLAFGIGVGLHLVPPVYTDPPGSACGSQYFSVETLTVAISSPEEERHGQRFFGRPAVG